MNRLMRPGRWVTEGQLVATIRAASEMSGEIDDLRKKLEESEKQLDLAHKRLSAWEHPGRTNNKFSA